MPGKCSKCNNELRYGMKKVYTGMGKYKREVDKENPECSYCIWKGDAGPGAKLKSLIKETNNP